MLNAQMRDQVINSSEAVKASVASTKAFCTSISKDTKIANGNKNKSSSQMYLPLVQVEKE